MDLKRAAIEGPDQPLHADDLAHLERVVREVGAPVRFGAPASEPDLAPLEAELGRPLPQDVKTLYRWHQGAEQLMPSNDFLSPAKATEERATIRTEIGELWEEFPLLRNLLPLLQDGSYFYMVRFDKPDSSQIYRWSYWSMEPRPVYASLLHLVRVIEQAYLSRAFHRGYDGWYADDGLVRRVEDSFQPALVVRRAAQARVKCAIAKDSKAPSMERQLAVRELYYEPTAVPTLIELLGDPDAEVVRCAAFGLGAIHAREALPKLLELLGRAPRVAADALAGVLTPEDSMAVGPLLSILAHADQSPRLAALHALAAIRSPEAVPAVIEVLRGPDAGLYWYAIRVLANTRDPRAVEPLRNLLERRSSLGLDAIPRGGSRGSAPTPEHLRLMIEPALEYILAAPPQ